MRTISIDCQDYKVENFASVGMIRLTKEDGTYYEIELHTLEGLRGGEFDLMGCDCPHFAYRLKGGETPCKHILALHKAGIIESYSDRDEAAFQAILDAGHYRAF